MAVTAKRRQRGGGLRGVFFVVALLGAFTQALQSVSFAAGTAATPTFSPAGGSYTSAQSVSISDTTAGATVYYTIDGTTPTTASTAYTGPISMATTTTLKAIAVATGYSSSALAGATYTIKLAAATPAFSPSAGTYTSAQSVSISDTTAGATIYYTTNGTTPTTASTPYTGPISIANTTALRAVAAAAGYSNSAGASATYTINLPAASRPTFSPAGSTYTSAQSVSISDTTAGATIYYTTNGTNPSTASTPYTGPISVGTTATLMAIAVAAGYSGSALASATYTIKPPAASPTFSLAQGTYTAAQSVSIGDTIAGTTIYYTTNGATPSTASTHYTGPISLATTTTLKAIALASGYSSSAVASAQYTINLPAAVPTLSPLAGTYTSVQSVSISDTTGAAKIYYTTDGTTPTTASTPYTGPINVGATATIQAIAVAAGYSSSAVAGAQYTINLPPATPTFSPPAGTYASAQSVSISDATGGAMIYYTTDGSTPTSASTPYTGAISVTAAATIQAIAVTASNSNSTIAGAQYNINNISPGNCPALSGMSIPATDVKLASGGAIVTSATLVAATSTLPQYCQVLGTISPVNSSAANIDFEVNLPLAWNSKALEYGGGGFNGGLITGLQPLTTALPSLGLPLAQGYATYGTDSGHESAGSGLAVFALNSEELTNFAYASYDKTHDVAVYLLNLYYGKPPTASYYFGHSEGGREALAMAQLFPGDFNGVVALSPTINWTLLQTYGNAIGEGQQNGGWLDPAKLQLLATTVNSACDSLDGIADGVVSNYLACNASVFDINSLECPGGGDTGDTCLSAAQIAEINTIHAGYSFPFTVANGLSSYPPFLYGGESQTGGMESMMGTAPAGFPDTSTGEGNIAWYGSDTIKYFYTASGAYNPLNFNPASWQSQLEADSALMDMTNPDLSQFYANGGKLILLEGTSDYTQSPNSGINYYLSVEAQMGTAATSQFMRLYISPGTVHNGGGQSISGATVPSSVDLLGALDSWVTAGSAPGNLVQYREQSTAPFAVTASRPLCTYAQYPAYISGDSTLASSYACTGTAQ